MQTHARTLLVATDWVAMTGLTRRRPLPDGEPVLPHVRAEGRHPRLGGGRAPRCSPSRCSTSTGRSPGWPPRASPCCPARRRSTRRSSTTRTATSTTCRACGVAVTGAADIPVELIRRIFDELPFSVVITGYGLTEGGTAAATVARRRPRDDRHHRRPAAAGLRAAHRRRPSGATCRRARRARSCCAAAASCRTTSTTPRPPPRRSTPTAGSAPATSASIDDDGLPADRRPLEGHVHRRRLQRLPGRDRERPAAPPRHPAGRGDRHPRRAPRRGRHGLRRARARDRRRPGTRSSSGAATQMANYKVPRRVELVDELPVNATGKVVKDELRARRERPRERTCSTRRSSGRPPRTATASRSGSTRTQWTFADLDRLSDAFAHHLADRGVGPRDRVAMMTTNRVEFPIAVNAISKLGAAAVLLSPAWKAAEVDHALVAHRPGARRRRRPRRRRCSPSGSAPTAVTDLDDAATGATADDAGRRAVDVGPDDEAILVFSSGTTGLPKAVRHTHRSIGAGTAPLGAGASGSPPTTASRWPPRRRTSSACSTCWPPPRPAPPCGCTAASTSTRCCAASSPTGITLEMAVAPIALAIAGPPGPRGARPLLAPLHHVGRHAGHRERGRGRHRAHRRAVAPGLRRQRAAGDRVQPGRPTRRVAPRLGRPARPRGGAAGRRPRHRRGARARRHRRDPGAQPVADEGLPARGGQRRGLRRRLVPHRRRRLARARGLGAPHRSLQGDDQGQGLPGGARPRWRPCCTATPPSSTARCSASPTSRPARCRSPPCSSTRRSPSTPPSSSSSWPTRSPPTSSCATSWSSTRSPACPPARCCAAPSATSGRPQLAGATRA